MVYANPLTLFRSYGFSFQPTRTLSVKDGARPSGWSISCVYPTMHDRVTHST
nr:MAG TPA: hypothetical protein [Caudoviricetes sp.]